MERYFEFRFIADIISMIIAGLTILGYIIYIIYLYFKQNKKE